MSDSPTSAQWRYPPWLFPAPVGQWSLSAAIVLGLCWPLGFAPFDITPLPILLLAALFALTARQGPKAAFWHAYLFAWAGFATGLYWLSHTLHVYGFLAWPVAIAGMLLLSAFLALYPALALALARYFFPKHGPGFLLAMPALWILLEWLRGHLFTGFPWLSLGYSQTLSPLGGLAPYGGVYGVGLAAAWIAGLLAWSWGQETRRALWIIGLPLIVGLIFLAQALGHVDFTRPLGQPLKVSLLQGNIPQEVKWTPEAVEPTLSTYAALLLKTPAGTDLALLPESAVPLFRDEAQNYVQQLAAWSRKAKTDVILGLDERVQTGDRQDYYNSALAVTRGRAYHKRHLVPFGEYVPLRPWIGGLINQLVPGQGDFSRGEASGLLPVKDKVVGLSICYEIVVEQLIRADVLAGAQLLLNISNDDWFGDTIAPHQHLQMAQMRVREQQRELARATNTGVTVIVGADGRVRERLAQFKSAALNGQIQAREGFTPYARFGETPVFALIGVGLFGAWLWGGRMAIPKN